MSQFNKFFKDSDKLTIFYAVLGVIIFIIISTIFSFGQGIFQVLFPKPPSHANVGVNLVADPSFETNSSNWANPWIFESRTGAVGTITHDSTDKVTGSFSAQVNVTQASATAHLVQLRQRNINLVNGTKYEVSFLARASTNRSMLVVLQQSVSPFQVYVAQTLNLTNSWKLYTFTYDSTVTDPSAYISFNFAGSTGQVWLDDISVSVAGKNLVANGLFETPGSTWLSPGWIFEARTGAAGTITQDQTTQIEGVYSAKIDVTQAASDPNQEHLVQLRQRDINISSGRRYEVSFWAKASALRSMSVVLQKSSDPYTVYKAQDINLTTTWQQYSFTYDSTVTDATAYISFNFSGSVGQVWLDNIVVQELMVLASPVPSPSPIPELVTNPSFEITGANWLAPWFWDVKTGAAGTIVQDGADKQDGNFSAKVDITQAASGTGQEYLAQLKQNNIKLENGKKYEVSFWAKASASRRILVTLQQSVSPFTVYGSQRFTLTTAWQQYSFTYDSTVTDATAYITLNFAETAGQVWVDNISVKEVVSVGSPLPTPVPSPVQSPSPFPIPSVSAGRSVLWGANGELWSPTSRLPDFSFAGYKNTGENPPNIQATGGNQEFVVTNYDANGSDISDDSNAFLAARDAAQTFVTNNPNNWAIIKIPAGKYYLSKPVDIRVSRTIIRGDGQANTTLYYPRPLCMTMPVSGHPCGALPTTQSRWSFSEAYFQVRGSDSSTVLANVTANALRGSNTLQVSTTSGINQNSYIRIIQQNPATVGSDYHSLAKHIHGDITYQDPLDGNKTKSFAVDEPGFGPNIDIFQVPDGRLMDWSVKVTRVDSATNTITLERPLRINIETRWNPQIMRHTPTITNVGFEDLHFQFAPKPYRKDGGDTFDGTVICDPSNSFCGHLREPGDNAIEFKNVSDVWVRGVTFTDSDSAIFLEQKTRNCHLENTVFIHTVPRRVTNDTGTFGHHGIEADGAQDCLVKNFDFRNAIFYHDLTVQDLANGNVFMDGFGEWMNLDHHKTGPYENLFTNIHVGNAGRIWRSSGNCLTDGPATGARETFWNIKGTGTWYVHDSGPPWQPCESLYFGRWGWPYFNSIGVGDDINYPKTPYPFPPTVPASTWPLVLPTDNALTQTWHIERVRASDLQPQNLYIAQISKRFGGLPSPSPIPSSVPSPIPTPIPSPSPSPIGGVPSPSPIPSPIPTPVPTPLPSPVPSPVPCRVATGAWGSSVAVNEGVDVDLNVTTTGDCNGKRLAFEVWENDSILEGVGDDPVSIQPVIVDIVVNQGVGRWKAEYQEDGFLGAFDPPEYYFLAWIVGDTTIVRSSDPLLAVSKTVVPQPTPVPSPVPSPIPSPIPPSPSPIASVIPSPIPTVVPSPIPTPVPTPVPSPLPSPIPCRVATGAWSSRAVNEDDSVELLVTTSGDCMNKRVAFEVWENDSVIEGVGDDPVSIQPVIVDVVGSQAKGTWKTEYQEDGFLGAFDPPEYYFLAWIVGDTNVTRSVDPLLEVNKTVVPQPTPIPSSVPSPIPTPIPSPSPSPIGGVPSPSPIPSPIPTPVPTPLPSPVPCTIANGTWNLSTLIREGTLVTLKVNTNGNCANKRVVFEIRENDSVIEGVGDDPVDSNPAPVLIVGSEASTTWVAEYQEDGLLGMFDPPEYYFEARIEGETGGIRSQDPLIKVNASAQLVISSLPKVDALTTQATITWSTNRIATTLTEYELPNKGFIATPEKDTTALVRDHTVAITNLNPCTTYRYRVVSKDISSDVATGEILTFNTAGCLGEAKILAEAHNNISVNSGGVINLVDANLKGLSLDIPADYAASDTQFQVKQLEKQPVVDKITLPIGYSLVGNYIYNLTSLTDISTPITSFVNPIDISISYSAEDVVGFEEDSFLIYRYDGSTWQVLTECDQDFDLGQVSCQTSNFSAFALFGTLDQSQPTPSSYPSNTADSGSSGGDSGSSGGSSGDGGSSGGSSNGGSSSGGGSSSDLNTSGKVDIIDLSILLRNWGRSGTGDLNGSGKVDIIDLSILLRNWSR